MRANKNLVLVIIATVIALLVVAIVGPLASERDAQIDAAIENDFWEISYLVDEYYSSEGRIPDELSDLPLSSEIEQRASKHNYSIDRSTATKYELCATFKTDTTSEGGSEKEMFYYGGFSEGHTAGDDCIEFETYGYYYDEFEDYPVEADLESYDFGI